MGNHQRVIEMLLDGKIAAGATYEGALEMARSKGLPVQNLNILARSSRVNASKYTKK